MPALVTPFKDGGVDHKTLSDLVEWHIAEGSHGLVPVGTTGESPTLTHDEHEEVIETVVKTAAGRVPVIAGAGSNNTAEAIRFVEYAKEAGADAALVVTPYYNKPSQEGMYRHFAEVAAVGLPVIIYNIPPRSIIDMTPETMGRLAELPEIIGVKDATAKLDRVSLQRITCGTDFVQLSGEDGTALAHMAHGGRGCISVTANVAPKLCSAFQEACLAGDYAAALELQDRLMPLHAALFLEPSPAPVKYALSRIRDVSDEVRLPVVPVGQDTRDRVDAALRHAGLLN